MFSYLLPLLALAGTAFSVPAVAPAALNATFAGTALCGNNPSAETFIAFEKAYAAKVAKGPGERAPNLVPGQGLPVHFKIIMATDGRGNVPDNAVYQQVNVMNQNFGGFGFTWYVASIQRYNQNAWYNQPITPGNFLGQQMKNALSGPAIPWELKVYLVAGAGAQNDGAVAYSSFPMDFGSAPTLDGIIINHNAFFGGDLFDLNTGKLLVHEMGHWCGLYHPFEGGCNGGDGVDDTPAEAISATVCAQRDSCPGSPGFDDVTNHMDYTKDSCRNHFTFGQVVRMRGIMSQFRGIFT